MATRWCTMEEVQADLALATGQRRRAQLVNEGCLVYGERPPPRLTAAEECEEEHQMKRDASTLAAQQPAPDLSGITNMLRMVQNYGDGDRGNSTSSNDDVIIISKPIERTRSSGSTSSSSKLNPNARRFVPRSAATHAPESGGHPEEGDEPDDNAANLANENAERAADTMTDEQRAERQELEAMLRSNVRAAAPERAPAAPALLTPDYFSGAARAQPDERELRASISKVTAWLQAPAAAPPSPAPAVPSPQRRRAGARPPPPAPAPPRGDERYEPSARARELSAQYAARAAAAAPPAGLWERLEAELRRREAS